MKIGISYFAMLAIWSTVPLALKWSMAGTSYTFAVSARVIIAAVFMVTLLAVTRIRIPYHRKALQTYAVSSVNFMGMMMLYWGAQFVPSGWIGVTFGFMPLMNAVMCALWLGERDFDRIRVWGLLIGFGGILVIFAKALDLSTQIAVAMLSIVTAVTVASGVAVWIKRIGAHLPGPAVAGGGLIAATPFYLLVWLLSDGSVPADLSTRNVLAILYIAVIGTGVVFTLLYFTMKHISLARLALIGMISPVTTLMLGKLLNDEPMSMRIWIGTGLIVVALILHEYVPLLRAGRDIPPSEDQAELEEARLISRYD